MDRIIHALRTRLLTTPMIVITIALVTYGVFHASSTRYSASPAVEVTQTTSLPNVSAELEVELITLRPEGFEPSQITRAKGPFVMLVDDRSGKEGSSLKLQRLKGEQLRDINRSGARIAREAAGSSLQVKGAENNWVEIASGKSRFRLAGLDAGRVELSFRHPGYATQGRGVDVRPGEVAQVEVALRPLAFVTPYRATLVFDGHIQAGYFVANVGDPAAGGACASCAFAFDSQEGLEAIVLELHAGPTVTNPTRPNDYFFELASEGKGGRIAADHWADRDKRVFHGGWVEDGDAYTLSNTCGLYWPCLDQRYTLYLGLFYHEPPASNFTNLPPE